MNIELLESFGQNYPEENDGTLDCITMALTCAFNRFGTLLAVGCNDGRVVIWDFLTRGIAKILSAHVHPVCSLSWSRSGAWLVSASTDNSVSVWNVLSGECDHKFRFPSPVLKVQFHPRREYHVLVCPMKHPPVVVDLTDGSHAIVPTGTMGTAGTTGPTPAEDESEAQVVAAYDQRGEHIFAGNAKGRVTVVALPSDKAAMRAVTQFKVSQQVSSTTAIKSIEFARKSGSFLVNTADRVIRVYKTSDVLNLTEGKDPEPDQKLQDLVNKTMWKKCCFSGDGEYVCAGSARQHALYIWEKATGTLMKILHGLKGELLADVVWHPVRPIVASISQGVVTVWAQQQVENWSAFAPDFKELDENVDYEERESEFDLEDEDKSVQLNEEEKDDDIEVDVANNAPIPVFCSSDEDEEDPKSLLYLPSAPDIEEPEEHYVPGVDGSGPDPSLESPGSKRGAGNDGKDTNQSKKKRTKTTEINLTNAPKDEVHPMMAKSGGAKDKSGAAGKRTTGRPKAKDKKSK